MKFGAFLWQRRGEDLAANARLAEQLGFESVWMGEHLGFPIQFKSTYPYDESGIPPVHNDTAIHDPLIVFAYLAAVTTTIKFGTGVYILPLRNPFAVAKAIASLDQLSNGRFLFGVGIGWLEEEFEWVGMDWDNRARRNNEMLKLMDALFTQEVPKFKGETVSTEGFYFNPKPVQQPHPPYIIGGNTDAAIKRACRLGDGWYGIAKQLDKALELVKRVREIEKGYNRASRWNSRWGRNGVALPSTMSGGSRKPVLSGSCPRGWSHATHWARCVEFTKPSCRSFGEFRGLT